MRSSLIRTSLIRESLNRLLTHRLTLYRLFAHRLIANRLFANHFPHLAYLLNLLLVDHDCRYVDVAWPCPLTGDETCTSRLPKSSLGEIRAAHQHVVLLTSLSGAAPRSLELPTVLDDLRFSALKIRSPPPTLASWEIMRSESFLPLPRR